MSRCGFVLLGWLGLTTLLVGQEAPAEVLVLETRAFLIAGTDTHSVLTVREWARGLEELHPEYLLLHGVQPAMVRLRPTLAQPYVVRRLTDGAVGVDVRWSADMTTDDLLRAILACGWQRWAQYHSGEWGNVPAPWWLEAGIMDLRIRYNSALLDQQRQQLANSNSSEVPAYFFSAFWQWAFSTHTTAQVDTWSWGYWELQAMWEAGDATLRAAEVEDARLLFEVYLAHAAQPPGGWAFSLPGAAWRVEASAFLPVQFRGAPGWLSPVDLWPWRAQPWVRQAADQRAWQIRTSLLATHPYYYNTLLSLGQAWEALAQDLSRDELTAAWSQALIDWQFARQQHLLTEKLLDDCDN